MKKISRINKTQEFKFSYKDLIQRAPINAGQSLVLFFGGLLAKSAWALHQEASLVAGGALAAHNIHSTQAVADSDQQPTPDDNAAAASHAIPFMATSALPVAVDVVDTQSQFVQTDEGGVDAAHAQDIQLAALDTASLDKAGAKSEVPNVQLTVDLSDLTLGTPQHLPTVEAPLPELLAPSPVLSMDTNDFYLKWLGLFIGGGTAGSWTDFAAGVVSSSTSSSTIGGYAIDGAVYNSVVYRYDSAKSSSNYTDIFGDGSVYDYVWGGSAGVRYTTSAGAYYALPTSGGSGGAIKVMASTSSYDMGWDSSKTYGFNTPLIMSSPYDTGTGQVVNPFTTLIQGLIDNDSTMSVATAASRVSTAFGLTSKDLGITSASELLYFNPLDYTSSSTAATKAAAIAMQAKAIEIVATISGGTQAVLAQNTSMDEVSVTKAILSSLVSYVGTNYAAGVDLSSATVIDSVLSSVTADNSSGTSTTVYLSDQALSTIAAVNDYVYLNSTDTTLAEAYAVQLQLMKNTDYSDAAFKALSNVVIDASNGDTILALTFTSTSMGAKVDNVMSSLVADPTIKIDLSSISYTTGDSLVVSDLTNTYEHTFTTAELKAGITAGYITFNLSDLESSGVSLSLSEAETFVVKAYLNKSGSTVDGSGYLAFMQNTTGNSIAYISGTPTGTATEDSSTTASGTLTVTDTDSGEAVLIAQSSVAGDNGYGTFTVTAAGAWTYTLSATNATIQALGAGVTTTDTLTVYSADGTDSQKITVTITGVDDLSTISGTSTATLTETNAAQSTSGTLTVTDVDSNNTTTFVAQTNAAGTNGYGKFTVTTAGVWTYTMNSAQNAFVSGTTYTDSVTVATSDGTTQTVTVTMTGTDDASTISGTSTATLTETNAAQSTSGTLTVTDVDSTTTFVAQTDTAGTNGYGTFSVTTGGVWTYTMSSAQNAFVSGTAYTDSVTVATSDGTTQTVTVTITGSDDASTISGTSTATLTETDAIQTATGTLTVTDVDSTTTFVAQTNAAGANGYGTFSVTTGGVWTYTMNTAHDEFVSGTTYTDSVTVATSDGTTQTVTVTMTGTDDASTISGTSTASLTETNAVQTATGTLTVTDVDSTTTFVAQTDTAGTNGYGTFSVTTAGVWTYTMNSAQNAFEYNTTYTDSVTVTTSDGTTQTVTVTMTGTNDAATITGTSSMSLTETDAAQSTSGTLVATDADSATTFVAQTDVDGDSGYGTFSVTTAGVWTYTMSSAQDLFEDGVTYTDSITVATADGTTQTVTVSIVGTNDSATIDGDTTGSITDYNTASQSTTGILTSTDVDGTANLFTAETAAGTYGSFVLATDGSWTYSMTAAQNFDAGSNHTDSFTAYADDGTAQTVTLTIKTPGVASATLTETDAAQSVTGTLSSATYVAQTSAAGSNAYGKFTLGTDGAWTYTMDSAQNAFASGTAYTDTLTATDSDGNETTIIVTITGTNDSATIAGTSTATLTESDVAQTASGTLTVTDVDSTATFVAQSSVAGTNSYGTFSLTTGGVWTYTMNSAQNAFVFGTNYTDSFTAASADGTTKTVTVTMTGTNDAATFGGATTVSLTETNAAQTTTGTLTVTDVDSTATFVAQTLVAGGNGYGKFSVTTGGVWTYTMNSAQNAFVDGTTYTDTFTVKSYDGSSQVVTVSIAGSNDAAVISGTSTYSLTETNAVLTTSGTLTSTDVDGTANLFTAETVTGSYGSLTMLTTGAWTYTASSTNDAFVLSTVYTDTFTVHAGDGTASTITVNITGTNDAAVISGTSTYSLTETDAVLTTSGTLTSTDVDGTANLFTSETVSGSYGSLVMATSGTWTYTAASTYNSMVAGAVVSDTFTVHAADGTSSSITVSITGTNDTPVMASSTASITLDQGSTSQTIATVSATDADLVGALTYSVSRQNGDASADYFTVNASTGVVTFTSAGAIATAVDATDTNGDGVMDTPYVIHVIATDDKGAYATETITVNVDMAVSSSGLTATLPGTTSNWSFAPQTTTSGDSTVSDGFRMTSTTNSSVYINLSSTVTSLTFAADATNSLTLANDASTGTVTDTSTSNHNFTITTGVTENTLLQVKAATTQTITGVTDTTEDPDLGTSTNYRDDTLQITDAAFTDVSKFSMTDKYTLQITMSSGGVKTLTDIEAVKFTDHTVRIVSGDSSKGGYASFLEAINQGNTSHAAVNDYVYGSSSSGYTPTTADLTHLTAVSGHTDFYTYNG